MKLVLLGTTGYHPNDTRQTACFMLPEVGVVLDAGTGMYRVRDHLLTPQLDIFVTHAHFDHVIGLTYLFDVFFERPMERVTIHGEADKLAAIHQHLFAEAMFPAQLPYEFRALEGPVELAGGGKLTYFPVEHPGGAVGFRLDWPGRSMAYVTDTVAHADAAYVERIRGVDLLLHECYFKDDRCEWAEKTGHSCTSQVGALARAAGVKRLVLVHVDPIADEKDPIELKKLQREFPNAQLGYDGMQIEF